jgi:hypothetical protein
VPKDIIHANFKDSGETLCGKPRYEFGPRETTLEVPELGFSDPKWVTCEACLKTMTIEWV